jgi:hypothetical protein
MKVLFVPVSLVGGLAAGMVAKKVFHLIWRLIDDQDPPDAKHREVDYRKLFLALLLEGAISSLVRGALDHTTRHGFARLSGAWPGEEEPEGA